MTSAFSSGWRVDVINVVTGQIVYGELPVTQSPSFDRTLNQIGSISIQVPLFQLTNADLRALLAPWRNGLMVSYNNAPLQAGPIVSVTQSEDGMSLTVGAQGIWGVLFHRPCIGTAYTYAEGIGDPNVAINDLTFTNGTLAGIAQGIVQAATVRTGDTLPITYPSVTTAGTSTRNYRFYEMTSSGQRLQEITQVDGGPDVDFQPVLSSTPGYMQWQMRTGQPFLTQPNNQVVYADYGAGLQNVSVDTDGSNMTMGAFAKGSGTDIATEITYAQNDQLTTAGWPRLYSFDSSHSSVTDFGTLYAWSLSDLNLNLGTVEQWSTVLRIDAIPGPALGSYVPGDFMALSIMNHPWIADGTYVQRILGITNDSATTVKLTLLATSGKV